MRRIRVRKNRETRASIDQNTWHNVSWHEKNWLRVLLCSIYIVYSRMTIRWPAGWGAAIVVATVVVRPEDVATCGSVRLRPDCDYRSGRPSAAIMYTKQKTVINQELQFSTSSLPPYGCDQMYTVLTNNNIMTKILANLRSDNGLQGNNKCKRTDNFYGRNMTL